MQEKVKQLVERYELTASPESRYIDLVTQIGELGKVDVGGGGTIAQYVANLGLNVLDCGTPILCMHAPFEIISKADIYMAYKAFYALFN